MHIGINLEFARSEQLSLEEALSRAVQAGYRFAEPYVYSPVSVPINSHLAIQAVTPYHHVDTANVDTQRLNELRKRFGLQFSAIDAHATLLMPELGMRYIRQAIEFAVEVESPVVMSDEGPVCEACMSLEQGFDVMCLSLESIIPYAQSHGVQFALELHNALTARPDMLAKLLTRFGPDEVGVNFDTGNAFLAGNDPVEYLRSVAGRVVHVHIKDIPASQIADRGKVTGTRVGVAAGDGVIDLPGVVGVLAEAGYEGVLSIECDTLAQGGKSLPYMLQIVSSLESSP